MVLVKNRQFFHRFILGKIGTKNEFHDILKRKRRFFRLKNMKFKKSTNWDFFIGVSPWFWSNIGNFSFFLF